MSLLARRVGAQVFLCHTKFLHEARCLAVLFNFHLGFSRPCRVTRGILLPGKALRPSPPEKHQVFRAILQNQYPPNLKYSQNPGIQPLQC